MIFGAYSITLGAPFVILGAFFIILGAGFIIFCAFFIIFGSNFVWCFIIFGAFFAGYDRHQSFFKAVSIKHGLRTTDYELWTGYETRTKHYALGIKYGLRYKTRTEHYTSV